jgi:hypothetical protein
MLTNSAMNNRERTDTSRARTALQSRRIKMPDGRTVFASTDPKEIAAELRAKSKLGERERKQREAEAKVV